MTIIDHSITSIKSVKTLALSHLPHRLGEFTRRAVNGISLLHLVL